jgi:uncharacterized membrane protein YfcA
MTTVLRLTQHQAHGTSLFAVMSTGLAGALSYGDHVDVEVASAVALCGMFSARLGAKLTSRLSGPVLTRALGVLMLVMAPAVPMNAYIMEQRQQPTTAEKTITSQEMPLTRRILAPCSIGLCSGFLAGVFGVGGGVIVVPALVVAMDLSHKEALGTSLAAMALPAAVGTYTHFTAGNVAMRVAPALALGAFAGAFVGGKCGLRTNDSTLRWGFSSLLAGLGIRTLLKV